MECAYLSRHQILLLHFCCSNFSALALIQLRLPTRNCILVLPGREEIVSFAAMAKFSPFIGTQFIMVTWLSIFDREIGNQNSSMENMSSRSACARPVDCKLVQVGEKNNKSRKCVLFVVSVPTAFRIGVKLKSCGPNMARHIILCGLRKLNKHVNFHHAS